MKNLFKAKEIPFGELEQYGIAKEAFLDLPKKALDNLLTGRLSPLMKLSIEGKNVAGITETTDKTVAKADFNGLDHTNAIIAAYTEHSEAMDARDICSVLQTFNDGDNNVGYSDWYIPALGQLYEIYTNRTNINTALSAMTATQLSSDVVSYWSSSEYSSDSGWTVNFYLSTVNFSDKDNDTRVRFVRDI